jgi:hypothetical protein
MNYVSDKEHEARKRFVKDFPDAEILRKAMDASVLDDEEKEALCLFIYKKVPISIIAERLGYERAYFSRKKFKKILIKFVYAVYKTQNG